MTNARPYAWQMQGYVHGKCKAMKMAKKRSYAIPNDQVLTSIYDFFLKIKYEVTVRRKEKRKESHYTDFLFVFSCYFSLLSQSPFLTCFF